MNVQEKWNLPDKALERATILADWKANRIGGEEAWGLFTEKGLWDDREGAFHRYAVGSEAVSLQMELWGLPNRARSAIKRVVISGKCHGLISDRASAWLLDLFAARSD